jgi:hypothetical protein
VWISDFYTNPSTENQAVTFFAMLFNAIMLCGIVVMAVATMVVLWPISQALAVFSAISAIYLLHTIYGSYLDEDY